MVGLLTLAVLGSFSGSPAARSSRPSPPNIVVIMTDDMGYSDLGCYGGEIATPHLDSLASAGLRFTQFSNTGRCCPTRASLLTGLYAHQAGVGHMNGDRGPDHPGYRGRLTDDCVTIAEVLGTAGYATFATGKWHVGAKQASWRPLGRGFERFYGCAEGGGFHFDPAESPNPRTVVLDEEVVMDDEKRPPAGWYGPDAYTEYGLQFAREAVAAGRPFFWYLAHTAPHWPLLAPTEEIERYRGRFSAGWDSVRQARYDRMVEMGLVDPSWGLTPRPDRIPAWDSLAEEEREEQDLRMAVYAAMIDRVDQNVGRIVATLRELGVFKDTLILFLQDNGGCAEGGKLGNARDTGVPSGAPGSFVKYGECWANVSNTPFRRYKHWVHQGGIASPLIAHWPAGISSDRLGRLEGAPTHVIDLMPTCVELSGATYPEQFRECAIEPVAGVSLAPLFRGEEWARGEALYYEHEGHRAIRAGRWKLVAVKNKAWELYDLDADRTETNDLAEAHPERVRELADRWQSWAERCDVELPKSKSN